MDANVIGLLIQGGMAGILIYYMVSQSKKDEAERAASSKREETLMNFIVKQTDTLSTVVQQNGNIVTQVGNMQDTLIKLVEIINSMMTLVKIMGIDVMQTRSAVERRHPMETHELQERMR